MMEYKRFTEKRNGKNVIPLRKAGCGVGLPKWSIEEHSEVQSFLSGDAADRLAELEDKIEQGTLIELPCEVGDKVYEIETSVGEDDRLVYSICETLFSFECLESWGDWYFLTREEAEKRLKDLQE
jgi:hypothetical protein